MKTETKSNPRKELMKYIWGNYNFITEIYDELTIDIRKEKKLMPINDHFNLSVF